MKDASNGSKNDPFLLESPANFGKDPFTYNKNFKMAFSSYLKGEIDSETLQTLRNFPSLYEFDSFTKSLCPQNKLNKSQRTTCEISKGEKLPQEETSSQRIKLKIENANNPKENFYDMVKKVIKERIQYKKQMKSEVSQYRTFNSKFLEQFYSINKEYAEKITNKDLLSQNTSKKYYEKTQYSASKILHGCTVRGIVKRAGL